MVAGPALPRRELIVPTTDSIISSQFCNPTGSLRSHTLCEMSLCDILTVLSLDLDAALNSISNFSIVPDTTQGMHRLDMLLMPPDSFCVK